MVNFIYPPVSVSVSPAAGASTEAKQDAQIVQETATNAKLDTANASLASIDGKAPALVGGRVPVDGSGVTQPVSGPLTDAELRATAVPVSGTVTANTGLSQPLTDTQLRATAVPVSGPLTDTELRATPVPVSGTVTANTGLSQPLTDAQLRATAVPVSGPLTDTQLRASAVPVSMASSPAPSTNAGTVSSAQITVGTTAVRATVAGTAPNASRKKLIIKSSKNNTGAIYLGGSGVTTSSGLEIVGPDRLEFDFDSGDYYLISDTAAQVVEILEKV